MSALSRTAFAMKAGEGQDIVSRTAAERVWRRPDILSRPAGTRPIFDASPVYRDAHAKYARAFRLGDVSAIEDAFSHMQELGRAFRDGARWAEEKLSAAKGRRR